MDHRTLLAAGTVLPFPGMACEIGPCTGRGSNAIVYEASYADALNTGLRHRVLVKELFPCEERGLIRREGTTIVVEEEALEWWAMHRRSFERGNGVHLQLLMHSPGQAGGNVNTFALNGTLYTLLDYSGGRSLHKALAASGPATLRMVISRMQGLLTALDAFHSRGLLHLDVSPDNILLVGEGEAERVLLIDYNSVCTCEELCGQGDVVLSAKEGYTAPEVLTGMREAISPATDLFSAACVFYRLLTGAPPTSLQLNRKRPPDASDAPLLADAPATVKAQAQRLISRGLCVLPDRRYPSCAAMLEDLAELSRRLEGVGVSHAALWEAGRRSVQRLIRENPSLGYVERGAELYPLRIRPEEGDDLPAQAFLDAVAEGGPSALLVGEGGMGKSTALLRAALTGSSRYSPARPAVVYLPLMGRRQGETTYILDQVLAEMRFDARTRTMDDARHALTALLSAPARSPRLLLLLDGLNEAGGDTTGLVAEIARLAAMPGVRVILSSRTAPDNLALPRASMTRLDAADVGAALQRHGLLLPERDDVQQLLRTPMMLSLFIQTAQNSQQQVFCQSAGEQVEGYLDALCRKAARDEGQAVSYSVEAAVRLVLPALAREIQRLGQPADDQALLKAVSRCHRALKGRMLAQAFPEWIGHSREALGGHEGSAEAWYGLMVHDILWRRLGLLIRDERGHWHVLHQILQESLVRRAADNDRRLRSRRLIMGLTGGAALLLAVFACFLWLRPAPHDENLSTAVIDTAAGEYVQCGLQYQAMKDALSGKRDAALCASDVADWGKPASRTSTLALGALRTGGGKVIPWSGRELDMDHAEQLLSLPQARAEVYGRCLRALALIRAGGTKTTEAEFAAPLNAMLEADADAAWLLNHIVCQPHLQGMSPLQRQGWDTAMLSLPPAQDVRDVDLSAGPVTALGKALERSRNALNELNALPVMHAPQVKEESP